jgi:hypothetical protein
MATNIGPHNVTCHSHTRPPARPPTPPAQQRSSAAAQQRCRAAPPAVGCGGQVGQALQPLRALHAPHTQIAARLWHTMRVCACARVCFERVVVPCARVHACACVCRKSPRAAHTTHAAAVLQAPATCTRSAGSAAIRPRPLPRPHQQRVEQRLQPLELALHSGARRSALLVRQRAAAAASHRGTAAARHATHEPTQTHTHTHTHTHTNTHTHTHTCTHAHTPLLP